MQQNKTQIATKQDAKTRPLFSSGHRACAGCGQAIAVRAVTNALGPNVIIANATGCLEVTTTPYPESAWGMPWIHSLFENPAAIATGISAALKYQKKNKDIKVVAQGGDGSTFDIGFGLISGMWERGEDILYICYDNEAYSNTGMQASGATPSGANVTTAPVGKNTPTAIKQKKKDMIAIALAHRLPYVAQTTVGNLFDITAKVKKALTFAGPKYIQILVPCIPGWGISPDLTIKLGKLAENTGLYPMLEFENGELKNKSKLPTLIVKVEEYLKPQGRFKHLFKGEAGAAEIKYIQSLADENIKKYGLDK